MRTADIDDVYAVREAIESQAVKLIVRRGATPPDRQALNELERAIEENVARTIGDADLNFHHSLVACSGSSAADRPHEGLDGAHPPAVAVGQARLRGPVRPHRQPPRTRRGGRRR
jgi:DNA-binding GntR family transcriptional regulator